MTRPRLLDLFCGAGGAAVGYHRAGFDVVGVDIVKQPHYPFTFRLADALAVLRAPLGGLLREGDFDAIHASPPGQPYSTARNRFPSESEGLIPEVRRLLERCGVPWVVENVPGALSAMRSPVALTGEMFGLRVHRPRLFESNVMLLVPARSRRQRDPVAVYGKHDGRRLWTRKDGSELRCASLVEAQEAMGMDWADWHGTKEAIPPAYTEYIGRQLLEVLA